tara:strand:- start:326 stop:946 length:621 start_codon:yes stop_codon:yes gene_type:complete
LNIFFLFFSFLFILFFFTNYKIKKAKRKVGFAEAAVKADDEKGERTDEDKIEIGRITSKANIMVNNGYDTVLSRRKTAAPGNFMQRTMYFKAPALLETDEKNMDNIFSSTASPLKKTSSQSATKVDGDGMDGDLAAAAKAAGQTTEAIENKNKDDDSSGKFGMVEGVMISCLLNIFGVIMFLRLGWVIGQAGTLKIEKVENVVVIL